MSEARSRRPLPPQPQPGPSPPGDCRTVEMILDLNINATWNYSLLAHHLQIRRRKDGSLDVAPARPCVPPPTSFLSDQPSGPWAVLAVLAMLADSTGEVGRSIATAQHAGCTRLLTDKACSPAKRARPSPPTTSTQTWSSSNHMFSSESFPGFLFVIVSSSAKKRKKKKKFKSSNY